MDTLKFTTNSSSFDGRCLWLVPSQFKEGAKFAKENNIKNFKIWHGGEVSSSVVDLDLNWLADFPDIFYLEILLRPSKTSDIEAIHELKNLQYLTYFGYADQPLNHQKLQSLKSLYTHYDISQLNGDSVFSMLPNLKRLKLWHVKKQADCYFLGELTNVEQLELTWCGNLESLDGIENLHNLVSISTHRCSKLKDISALLQCQNLKGAWIESSKQLNLDAPTKLKAKEIKIGGPPGSAISKI